MAKMWATFSRTYGQPQPRVEGCGACVTFEAEAEWLSNARGVVFCRELQWVSREGREREILLVIVMTQSSKNGGQLKE